MTDRPLRVSAPALKAYIVSVFDRWGTPPAIADLTADLMVRTDLRGVDSHGVGMLPTYQRWHRRGWIVPAAEPKVARDEGTTAVVDGQQAFGHYTSTLAMELAIAKARAHGVGFVTCRNSNHYGAAANYSMMALAHDMIGLSMTNAGPAVVPTHGREAMLGTNPLSFAAPAGHHFPFVLDMATSTVAIGKLNVALRWGKAIPPGWALDEQGETTTDPDVAMKHRLLSPLGGTRELGGHKGYGLGMMVDILSGVLPGAVYGDLFQRSDRAQRKVQDVGHCFVAIDPRRFRPLAEFKRDMDDMFDSVKSSPAAEGQTRVYVAGEPEAETEARRRREGIPVSQTLLGLCNAIAKNLGVPPLA